MAFRELIAYVYDMYAPAIALRTVMSHDKRRAVERNLLVAAVFLLMLALIAYGIEHQSVSSIPGLDLIGALGNRLWGAFLIVFSVAFLFSAIEAMHRSQYFHGLDQVLKEAATPTRVPVSWEVASIVVDTPHHDIVGGFLDSTFGQEILYRVGIPERAYAEYYGSRVPRLTGDTFNVPTDGGVVLATYADALCKGDPDFVQFLTNNDVSAQQLIEAARWVTQIERRQRNLARWWSRDNLGRIPGIGKTWGYGETYRIEKYGHDLTEDHIWPAALMSRHREDDEVEAIETILARARQSNALLVSIDVMNAREKVAQLYHKIREGEALPPLEAKRVFLVDIEAIVSTNPDKAAFEQTLRSVLDQAIHGGNIIIYIEYLTTAIGSANTLGVDLVDILLPYLNSGSIQIVASATRDGFYTRLQRDNRLMQVFDVVQMSDVSTQALLYILEQRAAELERKTNVVTSVPALQAVARLADQYFPAGVMPDKAFDLLEELIPIAMTRNIAILREKDVNELVAEKSGVPVGEPTDAEREKLLSLEDFLHKRVVGQNEAVGAVAKALRRARAGVAGHERPMGSFLFLGPTGVGKTETAKALAEALFGDEDAMTRLDMSEYQGADALDRLIGSFETGTPGILATLIREKQYGVLLLDEFEKSDRNVHDLFLQVLDEGKFTDASGKSVNARNLIIIATSNAAADLLWKWEKEGTDVTEKKRALVDAIIERGLFRPEFLNRFDDVVVFQVLTQDQVYAIAQIQLRNFSKRLSAERRIDVIFDKALVEKIAEIGYDPQFGGRPMRRAIKDQVEQLVADKILAGDIRPGAHVTIYAEDLTV